MLMYQLVWPGLADKTWALSSTQICGPLYCLTRTRQLMSRNLWAVHAIYSLSSLVQLHAQINTFRWGSLT